MVKVGERRGRKRHRGSLSLLALSTGSVSYLGQRTIDRLRLIEMSSASLNRGSKWTTLCLTSQGRRTTRERLAGPIIDSLTSPSSALRQSERATSINVGSNTRTKDHPPCECSSVIGLMLHTSEKIGL